MRTLSSALTVASCALVLALVCPHPATASPAVNIDSLNAEFAKAGDDASFDLWYSIILHYLQHDPAKADSLTQAGLALAHQKGDKEGALPMYDALIRVYEKKVQYEAMDSLSRELIAAAERQESTRYIYAGHRLLSRSLFMRGLHQKQVDLFPEMIEAAEKTENIAFVAHAYSLQGDALRLIGRFKEARASLDKAVELCPKDSKEILSTLYINLGQLASTREQCDVAIEFYHKALELADELGDLVSKPSTHRRIARCYGMLEDWDNAILHNKKTIAGYEAIEAWQSAATGYGQLGVVLRSLNRYEESLEMMTKALEIFQDGGNPMNAALCMMHMAKTYGFDGPVGDREKCMDYYAQSLKVYTDLNDTMNMAGVKNNIGLTYYDWKQYDNAIRELSESAELAEVKEYLEVLLYDYQFLAKIYQKLNNYEKAYHYLALEDSIEDLRMDREKMAKIEELTTKYNTAEKERELLVKQQENAQLKAEKEVAELRYLVMGAGLGLAVLIALFIAFRQRSLIRRKQTEKELTEIKLTNIRLERQRLESSLREKITTSEQKALRAQMNPHFIFNTLNSIQLLIANNDQMLAMENVSKFAGLIRQILHNSGKSRISLADEISTLELYLEMENVRLKDRLTFSIEVDDQLEPEIMEVPPLVYQPFVENAIWHGIMNKPEKSGHIHIHFQDVETGIRCTITDDGIGITRGLELKKGRGGETQESLGMKITEERLQLLNGNDAPSIRIRELKSEEEAVAGTEVQVFVAA